MNQILMNQLLQSWIIGISIVVGVIVFCILICVIFKLKRQPEISKIIIDETFITSLLSYLGGVGNILECSVDNGRLKFHVQSLNHIDGNGLKTLSTSGVFITGNMVKLLFKYDSQTIKDQLVPLLGGKSK